MHCTSILSIALEKNYSDTAQSTAYYIYYNYAIGGDHPMWYIADCPETGDLRLVEGAAHYEGMLEIYFPDEGWGPICYININTFSLLEADTACRQLGYLRATSVSRR